MREGLDLIKRRHEVLKPRLGTFIVCREGVDAGALKDLETNSISQIGSGICLLDAGYDAARLGPIIEAIIKAKPTKDAPG